ncbi:MAG: hypothetical protein JNM13_13110 [Hyphomicrobiaceae bacterium]|nr:hypothetical protein [Hyphomicrobiaceae bacterium]
MRIDWSVLATGLMIAVIGTAVARANHWQDHAAVRMPGKSMIELVVNAPSTR